ncbi:MAG: T9SS type A sorting domain-containing protein [Bacteroidota bacterium]|nr:T9SS type A sorting domain-containing protein [Bacteroidota bacterium]
MKKQLLYIVFLFSAVCGYAQNLVPNGGFEIQSSCPTTLDQLNLATGWSSYSETPDYFHTCGATGLTPPDAFAAYQFPYNGNAYAGFLTMVPGDTNYREIIGTQLTSPLQIGTTYYFSFFVNFTGVPNWTSLATNKIGLRFSTASYSYTNPTPINNFAHYYCTTILNDSVNWVQLKGSFIADSIYQYIAIGNFFDDANMLPSDTLGMPSCNNWQAYYFIDDVAVSTDSSVAFATNIEKHNTGKNLLLYPNPSSNLLHISCNDILKQIEVFDMVGNLRLKSSYTFKTPEYTLDVSSLNNGIYVLKMSYQNGTVQKQIIISKQ